MDPGLTSGPGRVSSLRDLSGRILLHATLGDLGPVADLVDSHAGGIIVVQRRRRRFDRLQRLRDEGRLAVQGMPILRDAGAYARPLGSEPFELTDGLFGTTLADHLDQQIADGFDMAITPTRFIPARDDDYTLENVVADVDALGRRDTLCLLPLDIRWLSSRFLKRLDYALQHATNRMGIMFPSTREVRDPNGIARATLDALLADHPSTWLLRGDMTVLAAVAQYNGLGSIGVPRPRWFKPPQYRLNPQDDDTTGVLVPQLLQWLQLGTVRALADRRQVFPCDCPVCHHRPMHEIESSAMALRHNVSRWTTWANELRLAPDKPAWWRNKCNDALEEFGKLCWDEALRPHHDRLRTWAG